jgi:3-oxoacyl-[acyl-carrier-protein] synthase-1
VAPLAISAYSLCNALGDDTRTIIEALRRGASGLRPHDIGGLGEIVCGALPTPPAALPPSLSQWDTRQTRVAWQGLAGIVDAATRACRKWGAQRVGTVIGSSTGGIAATEDAFAQRAKQGALPAEFDLERHHAMEATTAVVRAAIGVRGPSYAISTACSSSAKAFASAQRLVELDVVDAVLVGGVDSLCRMTLQGFGALELVSPRACRPFAADRDGISIGEGAAWVLLERQADCTARLVAVGESSDAHHMSAPHPEGAGAKAAMLRALALGGIEPTQVSWINAHATGTPLNDAAEAKAIRAVLGASTPVVATKGLTGHLLGAAGATEAVLSILAIELGLVPASAGSDPVDPALGIDVVVAPREIESDYVLSNSFAFGGSNAAVLLGAAPR